MDFKENVLAAHKRIQPDIKKTPLQFSRPLSQMFGAKVYIKWENEQLTGSFKLRGALNKIRVLPADERKKGVVSASTGNHGLAISYASQLEKVDLTLFLPKNASPLKIEKLRNYPITLMFYSESCEKAEIYAREYAQKNGKIYISPYNDRDIVYGQGTLGVEIYQDLPDVKDIFVPVGGGGLISGIGGYLKALSLGIRIYGVEPVNSNFMLVSIRAKKIVEIDEKKTLADGVAGGIEPGSITFPLCQEYVDGYLTVTERLIKNSIALLYKKHRKVVEGAGALSLAGLMKAKDAFRGKKVVLVVSGGNIAPDLFQKIVHNNRI
jgi:threonine dehydratase